MKDNANAVSMSEHGMENMGQASDVWYHLNLSWEVTKKYHDTTTALRFRFSVKQFFFGAERAGVSNPLFPYERLLRQPDLAKGWGCVCTEPQPIAKASEQQSIWCLETLLFLHSPFFIPLLLTSSHSCLFVLWKQKAFPAPHTNSSSLLQGWQWACFQSQALPDALIYGRWAKLHAWGPAQG